MSITSDSKNKLHLRHDYCLKLSKDLTQLQIEALRTDLEQQGYNCFIKSEEQEWIFFIGLND